MDGLNIEFGPRAASLLEPAFLSDHTQAFDLDPVGDLFFHRVGSATEVFVFDEGDQLEILPGVLGRSTSLRLFVGSDWINAGQDDLSVVAGVDRASGLAWIEVFNTTATVSSRVYIDAYDVVLDTIDLCILGHDYRLADLIISEQAIEAPSRDRKAAGQGLGPEALDALSECLEAELNDMSGHLTQFQDTIETTFAELNAL